MKPKQDIHLQPEDNDSLREHREIFDALNRYEVESIERLRSTVKVYDAGEYSQEVLMSLIPK